MERWIEGDRNKRMKLDKGPWNSNKIIRKTTKQFLWITFALWTGFTFVGFFTPIREFGANILAMSLGALGNVLVVLLQLCDLRQCGLPA